MEQQEYENRLLSKDIEFIKEGMKSMNIKLDTMTGNFITKDQHALLIAEVGRQGKIIYGICGVAGVALLGAIIGQVFVQ